MKKLSLLLSMMLLVMAVHAGGKKTAPLKGNWTGVGYQVDGKTWQVVLDVSDEGISVTYPNIDEGCTGKWTYVKKKKGVYEFIETIDKGPCDNNVQVLVTTVKSCTIAVTYYLPGIIEGVAAHAALEK
jgi:hypothetical protein